MKRVLTEVQGPSIAELEAALAIDEHALDEACQSQAEGFYRVAKALVLVTSQRDEAKQAREVIEAEVDAEIRQDAEVSGDKVTEKAIESQRKMNHKVQVASDKFLALNKQAGLLSALKESFIQRGYCLKDMITLYSVGYFGNEINPRSSANDLRNADARVVRREQDRMRRS